MDGTMHKWNCDTGLVVGEPWKGEGGWIYALALSPDGKTIACGREDGSVQQWTTDGEMMDGVWTGHSGTVRSLAWLPNGNQIASGSRDGTVLIRSVKNGKVEVGPINTGPRDVWSLAFSPSGERIASGSYKSISIWDAKAGHLVVGPIKDLGHIVTSLAWSPDSTTLFSASDRFARAFDGKTGQLLHRFEHDRVLWSIALSPTHNALACVGNDGVANFWDTEYRQHPGQPFHREHKTLRCVSFSPDGRYVAYGGDDSKLTLWMLKDIAPQLPVLTLPQQSDRRSTQQKTRPSSPSSSCLNADATGGDGLFEEVHDMYSNFFQSSQRSLPLPLSGFRLTPFKFSAHRLLHVFSRHCPPADESVPKDRSKRRFFSRRTQSNASLDPAPVTPNQSVPQNKAGESDGEQVDDCASAHNSLSTTEDTGKQHDNSSAGAQSPISDSHLHSKDKRNFLKRLLQSRGRNLKFGSLHSSTRATNGPKQVLRNPWRWNSSSFPAGPSKRPVDVAACREDDRYGIAHETDAEAAAAMLRPNDDVVDCSTQPGQPTVGAQLPQTRPAQTQASTSGPQEIGVSCCGFIFVFVFLFSCRRRSNSHQP
ncbi:hypothetical protein CY34DRAFT_712556 [Suillus luteus UH-Slu-Lm8-n1]|uniref:Anaphase-promoting complex subunit 4 WD40 domain-containing protein n=1 Tax=Suillus luteus UH-Slu-Lm8-n1 TaxID=930992 RepID=A0A0D0B077_9AGAM|nr:hypothetical protein CY34DRAFT_712556 [Suillus luteus UH-Slu-Lm8-n1]